MKRKSARDHAIDYIAAFDTPGGGEYEKKMVLLAGRWLKLLSSPLPTQARVDSITDELNHPPEDCGSAWADLRKHFMQWAIGENWLNPDGSSKSKKR